MPEDPHILIEPNGAVCLVTLNRPKVLNALTPAMLQALCEALEAQQENPQIRVIVLTGDDRAFAAGSDIPTLAQASPIDIFRLDTRRYWERLRAIRLPLIAAVRGFAYGGGCELALLCDLIVATENALFAQPEIKLGIIPGAGGTQRLAKAIGPYRAMEMILTGEPINGRQAYEAGLVNRLAPAEQCLSTALELAQLIASRPPIAVRLAREAVRYGVETTLLQGLDLERRNFLMLFDTQDQAEGMQAFLEKRPPHFEGK
jgi:enoyl-CoA hydratase